MHEHTRQQWNKRNALKYATFNLTQFTHTCRKFAVSAWMELYANFILCWANFGVVMVSFRKDAAHFNHISLLFLLDCREAAFSSIFGWRSLHHFAAMLWSCRTNYHFNMLIIIALCKRCIVINPYGAILAAENNSTCTHMRAAHTHTHKRSHRWILRRTLIVGSHVQVHVTCVEENTMSGSSKSFDFYALEVHAACWQAVCCIIQLRLEVSLHKCHAENIPHGSQNCVCVDGACLNLDDTCLQNENAWKINYSWNLRWQPVAWHIRRIGLRWKTTACQNHGLIIWKY